MCAARQSSARSTQPPSHPAIQPCETLPEISTYDHKILSELKWFYGIRVLVFMRNIEGFYWLSKQCHWERELCVFEANDFIFFLILLHISFLWYIWSLLTLLLPLMWWCCSHSTLCVCMVAPVFEPHKLTVELIQFECLRLELIRCTLFA